MVFDRIRVGNTMKIKEEANPFDSLPSLDIFITLDTKGCGTRTEN